jgi:uncharacterized protein
VAKILITGGSGLVGRALTDTLLTQGHEPRWLSRKPGSRTTVPVYQWDPAKKFIDPRAFEGVEILIHLAGAGIFDKRWTPAYRTKIISSRVDTSELLFEGVQKLRPPLRNFIGASAVGYYGTDQSDHLLTENDPPGNDFLANVCRLWENSYNPFKKSGVNTTIVRTAVVLSANGGVYKRLRPIFKSGLGAALGTGRQYFPWIHIQDLIAVYSMACSEKNPGGVYNAVSPHTLTNREFSEALSRSLNRPFFLPAVPAPVLRLLLGPSASAICYGPAIGSGKLTSQGFVFKFPEIKGALGNLAVQ